MVCFDRITSAAPRETGKGDGEWSISEGPKRGSYNVIRLAVEGLSKVATVSPMFCVSSRLHKTYALTRQRTYQREAQNCDHDSGPIFAPGEAVAPLQGIRERASTHTSTHPRP